MDKAYIYVNIRCVSTDGFKMRRGLRTHLCKRICATLPHLQFGAKAIHQGKPKENVALLCQRVSPIPIGEVGIRYFVFAEDEMQWKLRK